MRRPATRPAYPAALRGIALPTALFIIVLLALLGAGVARILTDGARATEEAVLLARAVLAAESGAGFGMHALFPPAEYPAYDQFAACPGSASPSLYTFQVEGLQGCQAQVSCNVDASVDGVDYYTITSAGSCGGLRRVIQLRSRSGL